MNALFSDEEVADPGSSTKSTTKDTSLLDSKSKGDDAISQGSGSRAAQVKVCGLPCVNDSKKTALVSKCICQSGEVPVAAMQTAKLDAKIIPDIESGKVRNRIAEIQTDK